MMFADEHARFLWVRIRRNNPSFVIFTLQFANSPQLCRTLHFIGSLRGTPFSDLYVDTSHYSTLGEVILLGNFNARTKNLQVSLCDRDNDALCLQELEPELVGLHRSSQDRYRPLIGYGRNLQQLGESHDLLIMNGPPCFPGSCDFTCFPHSGGASVVDYVLVNLDLLSYIQHFSISRLPLADHALLTFSLSTSPPSPAYPTIPSHHLPLR
jgi:hypothetical protein